MIEVGDKEDKEIEDRTKEFKNKIVPLQNF